ncbi:MAG: SprT family zinc-dependent metalloprotease [Porticoccaceae bacterium]
MNLKVNELDVELTRKKIKRLNLRVLPPYGCIKVSAPRSMKTAEIQDFVLSNLTWVKKQQEKCRAQVYAALDEYVDGESHYVQGQRFLLEVIERNAHPKVTVDEETIRLQVRPGEDKDSRRSTLDAWYRQQLEEQLGPLMSQWENAMDVSVAKFSIRKMKSRWGSCTPSSRSIRINLELAKKSPQCLEYIVVHELAHLLEPSHNRNFYAIMDKFLPNWRLCDAELKTGL